MGKISIAIDGPASSGKVQLQNFSKTIELCVL